MGTLLASAAGERKTVLVEEHGIDTTALYSYLAKELNNEQFLWPSSVHR